MKFSSSSSFHIFGHPQPVKSDDTISETDSHHTPLSDSSIKQGKHFQAYTGIDQLISHAELLTDIKQPEIHTNNEVSSISEFLPRKRNTCEENLLTSENPHCKKDIIETRSFLKSRDVAKAEISTVQISEKVPCSQPGRWTDEEHSKFLQGNKFLL